METVYLDYASTTPVDPRVLKEMLPYFTEDFGNPSSGTHKFGWKAKAAVQKARKIVAKHVGAEEGEIIFTSGATESINLAIKGIYDNYQAKGKHIISCKTEHKACLDCLRYLEENGAEITYLEVDRDGLINPAELQKAIRPDTILLSFMWINNETGTVQNIEEIGEIAKTNQVLFFCDATQALGKVSIDVKQNHISVMAVSAHKIYGPKGIGALYVSRKKPRAVLAPQLHGGSQEKGLRAGTLNTPAIVGFGKAIELLTSDDHQIIENYRNRVLSFFNSKGGFLNVSAEKSCPHIMNIQMPGTKASKLIKSNSNFAFSLGSACTSDLIEPSHVLESIGLNKSEIAQSFRISIGRFTSEKQIKLLLNEFQITP